MRFAIVGRISNVETIATKTAIRELPRLRRIYGRGRWRKRKGVALVRLTDGTLRRAEIHWYEATGIGRSEIQDQAFFGLGDMAASRKQCAVCVRNQGYEGSLERRKIYEVLPDPEAVKLKLLRVVDESGEDYLFPATCFAPIDLPQKLRKALLPGA